MELVPKIDPKYSQLKQLQDTEFFISEIPFAKGSCSTIHYLFEEDKLNYDYSLIKWVCKIIKREYANRIANIKETISKLKPHPNIVLHKPLVMESPHNYYLILEYCNRDSLQKYITQKYRRDKQYIEDAFIFDFLFQFSEGYKMLMENQIVHLDLKPDNILMHNEDNKTYFKISDFDLIQSHSSSIGRYDAYQGNTLFTAPLEVGEEKVDSIDNMFSLGTILYYMMYDLHHPYFESENDINQICSKLQFIEHMAANAKRLKQPISRPCPVQRNKDLVELVNQMLQIDKSKRITWQQLFQHPIVCQQYKNNDYIDKYTHKFYVSSRTQIQSIIKLGEPADSQNPPFGQLQTLIKPDRIKSTDLAYNKTKQEQNIKQFNFENLIRVQMMQIYQKFNAAQKSARKIIFLLSTSGLDQDIRTNSANQEFRSPTLKLLESVLKLAQSCNDQLQQKTSVLIKDHIKTKQVVLSEHILNSCEQKIDQSKYEAGLSVSAEKKMVKLKNQAKQYWSKIDCQSHASDAILELQISTYLEHFINYLLLVGDSKKTTQAYSAIVHLIILYFICSGKKQVTQFRVEFAEGEGTEADKMKQMKEFIIQNIQEVTTKCIIEID